MGDKWGESLGGRGGLGSGGWRWPGALRNLGEGPGSLALPLPPDALS